MAGPLHVGESLEDRVRLGSPAVTVFSSGIGTFLPTPSMQKVIRSFPGIILDNPAFEELSLNYAHEVVNLSQVGRTALRLDVWIPDALVTSSELDVFSASQEYQGIDGLYGIDTALRRLLTYEELLSWRCSGFQGREGRTGCTSLYDLSE